MGIVIMYFPIYHMKRYLAFILTPFLVSCGFYPQTPMYIQSFPAKQQPGKHLVILLGGQGAPRSYFSDHDWIELARQHDVDVDFIAPHAHLGYYMTNSLTTRMYEDVILPARQKGYKSISIAGISMGGTGAILLSQKFPKDIDRIYLISP